MKQSPAGAGGMTRETVCLLPGREGSLTCSQVV